MSHPDGVRMLERELRGVFGARLQSLVVYGTRDRGRGGHGGHEHSAPPVQTLAIVEALSGDDLRACTSRIGSWHDAGLTTPLLMAAHEIQSSLDTFPLEFGAILADHDVVSGADPFAGLAVEAADLRRAVEVQARSHLFHLREGYLETRGRGDATAVLIARSAAAFAALLQSVARLDGRVHDDAAAAARHVERLLDLPGGAIGEVAALVGVDEIPSAQAEHLFPPYLDAVERLVKYVDGWGRARA